jgi:hypothetical protein
MKITWLHRLWFRVMPLMRSADPGKDWVSRRRYDKLGADMRKLMSDYAVVLGILKTRDIEVRALRALRFQLKQKMEAA